MNQFILELQKKRSNYSHPDQATTQEQSLEQLSRGIYTEEERFIFELLQNAVDAYSKPDGCLNIQLNLQEGYLVFMHNGEPFSQRDIEGLCDVGYGSKMTDSKKIGYKGLGFKSVFMRSSLVFIESGDYCFKFDKSFWDNYWETHWETKFGERDPEKHYGMPWQIIPIDTQPPIEINKAGYNVITYIRTENERRMADKINKLLNSCQFLLFLRCKNIQMTFSVNSAMPHTISKETENNIVILSSNNVRSRWLLYTNDMVEIPSEVQHSIMNDIYTPLKLKGAKTFDLSFAIALDKTDRFRELEDNEAVIYTYLPMSFKFGGMGFPFLVNANFITDAGRQQLQIDSEWNRFIFSKIPTEFLQWMQNISDKYDNYYEILPQRTYGRDDLLKIAFADNMDLAIENIPFIPCEYDKCKKICARIAIMDRIGIADKIDKQTFIKHINQTYCTNLDTYNFIKPVWKGSKILSDYGVFIFDKKHIKELLEDSTIFSVMSIHQNIELIRFLYDYCVKNKDEEFEIIYILHNISFILDERNKCRCPYELYFPSKYKEQNTLASELPILHHAIYENFQEAEQKQWLSHLGIQELSNTSFIQYIFKDPSYITEENAIQIGRFLFDAYRKENFVEKFLNGVNVANIQFLTKQCNLKPAKDLYLGTEYHPSIDIEPIYNEDIYISQSYINEGESLEEWKFFFIKMGVNHDFSLQVQEWDKPEFKNYPILQRALERAKLKNNGPAYPFALRKLRVEYYPLIKFQNNNYDFAVLFWNDVLSKKYCSKDRSNIYGIYGWENWYFNHYVSFSIEDLGEPSFRKYLLKNKQLFPTSTGEFVLSNQIFNNSDSIKKIGGIYLPIIAVSNKIDKSWVELLEFKTELEFEDYMTILTKISEDEENCANNRERVSIIYHNLIEDIKVLQSDAKKDLLREWALFHRILSQEGKLDFAHNLSYITIDGFDSRSRAYTGDSSTVSAEIIEFLQLLGVTVITEDNIHPDFEDCKETNEQKDCLYSKVHVISLLRLHYDKDCFSSFLDAQKDIIKRIDAIKFYKCSKICLTYGDSNDRITKMTFRMGHKLYYTGDLRPHNLEPLMSPLCELLGIAGRTSELFILMIEDNDGAKAFLQEKGFDTSLIEYIEPQLHMHKIFEPSLNYTPSIIDEYKNQITGFKGEILIYEYLLENGYSPVCPSISNETDYEREVIVHGNKYYCKNNYDRYDIYFKCNNRTIFLEIKSTIKGENELENMPISLREWNMINECNNSNDDIYMIIRIFNVDSDNPQIYVLQGKKINTERMSDCIEEFIP